MQFCLPIKAALSQGIDDGEVLVQLQNGGGNLGCHRPIQSFFENFHFFAALGNEQNAPRLHDSPHAHGEGSAGLLVRLLEKARIGFERGGGEGNFVRRQSKAIGGLVKADMPVISDPKY